MLLARLVLNEPFQPVVCAPIRTLPFVIGRHPECQLVLGHASVSSQHARISKTGEDYFLEDLRSKNGTVLNGHLVDRTRLENQDFISLGSCHLIFEQLTREQWELDSVQDFERLRAALRISTELSVTSMFDQILDQAISGLMSLSGAERGLLFLVNDSGDLELVRERLDTSLQARWKTEEVSSSAIEKACDSRRPVVLSDAQEDSFFALRGSIIRGGLRTLVCVPIESHEEQILGLLYAHGSSRRHGFTELDIEVLSSLASSAAMAIGNSQLSGEIRSLLVEAGEILARVDRVAFLDPALQHSVRQTLTSLRKYYRDGGSGVSSLDQSILAVRQWAHGR